MTLNFWGFLAATWAAACVVDVTGIVADASVEKTRIRSRQTVLAVSRAGDTNADIVGVLRNWERKL